VTGHRALRRFPQRWAERLARMLVGIARSLTAKSLIMLEDGQIATRIDGRLDIVSAKTHQIIDPENSLVVSRDTHRVVPLDGFLVGEVEHFLLVPKNRYRLSLLPGQSLRTDWAVGWLTEENTPEGYDALWGTDEALERFTSEDQAIRQTLTTEIIDATIGFLKPNCAVLDVGCGVGDLLAEVARRSETPILAGCDFSPKAIERIKTRLAGEFREVVIQNSLPYADASFDIVYCTDVIEHLEYPADIVGELVRICRPGGYVCIVVPDGAVDTFFGHLWFWTEATLPKFLAPWGARISRLPVSREFLALIKREV
jgi:SAM-dependent methyltransferase